MENPISFEIEAKRSLQRLLPRLEQTLIEKIAKDPTGWNEFSARLEHRLPALFQLYHELYSQRYDFFYHLEDLLLSLAKSWLERSDELRKLDKKREKDPLWFQSNKMLGGVIYVDLFADDLQGLRSKIPYFQELGLTYLHLMPLFKRPEEKSDGGYAITSYREVHPPLGTMKQLALLSKELREAGISMVLDLVFNHTSNEHEWAQKALQGESEYQDMFHIFPDRNMPDAYERTLREIFPEVRKGQFTYLEKLDSWVWTTFHSYQWDLNYANPAVFNRVCEEMFFLANQGAEIIRLDAVAFIWKKMGTNCENLPEAHKLICAFNAAARISAPSLLFKSEAIVHPDEVVRYISPQECQLSYNPLLMALLWNSLATRKTNMLAQALNTRFRLAEDTIWVNYVRCHDDIGWTFSDEDAKTLQIDGFSHRNFLNEFYRGRFPGSFARGLPFQENLVTGDVRISGTCSSLAGLEKAVMEEGEPEIDLAVKRIALLHGIILTVGGIPLIYLGDEIGTLNDYTYREDLDKQNDSRWVHRKKADWEAYEKRNDPQSVEGKVYSNLQKLIKLRKRKPVFSAGKLEVLSTENEHVLGFIRQANKKQAIILANFSEYPQRIPLKVLHQYLLHRKKRLHGESILIEGQELFLKPLELLILE